MFDLTAGFAPLYGPAESQIGEGGRNAGLNCVITALSNAFMAMGYPDTEPEVLKTLEYGSGYTGYTDLDHVVRLLHSGDNPYPNPPAVWQGNPDDTLAALDEAGKKGWPNLCIFHIDNSVHFNGSGPGYHASNVVKYDGQTVWILNVWHGTVDTLSVPAFRAATSGTNAGSLLIFQRPIQAGGDLTSQEADAIRREGGGAMARIFWHLGFGVNVDGPDHQGLAESCVANGLDGGWMKWLDDPANTAVRDSDAARLALNEGLVQTVVNQAQTINAMAADIAALKARVGV